MGDPPPDPADGAEALAEWLAACDDALLSGRPLALPSAADGVPQAETELAWLLWVRSVWPADDPLSADTVATGPTEPLPQSVGPPSDSPPDRLLCRLELSGLLDPTELAAARAWAGRVPPTEAAATGLADHLVSSGKLTRFQADGLLAGRTRFTLAGRYVILDRLGAGGMGMVFHCRHAVMRHTVAVKLISEQLASDPENAERFRREARAAASLRHPNVVRALEMDQDDGRPFLVMEYVEGRTLADIVRRDGPLPVDAACDYAAQAADGLQAAHDTGLVHRDVKPANLLVDGDGVVKLVDLGLARFASDEADGLTANNTAILGTVDYLSPEQAMDSHRADARSDVYSLGATFYFLLTGRAPFQGRGTAEKLLAHQVRDPEPVQSVRPDVPDPVAAVLSRMLAKDPAQRFPTAAAAAAALRGETPVPPPVEPVAAPSGPSRAAWRLVAGSVVAGLVTLAVLVSSGRTNPAPKPAHRVVTPIEAATPPREVVPDPPPDWAAEVAKLPAEEQLAAVVRKLRENNPGYDGAVLERAFEAGAVVSLALPGQQLRGVSALRGLPRLRTLSIRATNEKPGVLAELRPLADLPLIDLRVSNCPVTDLTPLAGLPLTTLHLPNCPVYDLGPLRGMPLEQVNLLNIPATDLTPLRGLPLKRVSVGGSRLRDLGPLAGAPVTFLVAQFCPLTDLAPLRGMPLTELRIPGTDVTDLSPLRGLPLQIFSASKTRLRDLGPLAGMPLRSLDVAYTPVSDLGPLAGSPLRSIHITNTAVRDLAPIAGPDLTTLYAQKTSLADLSPLRRTSLRVLQFDLDPARDGDTLRAIPTLTTLNDCPAAEVLKK